MSGGVCVQGVGVWGGVSRGCVPGVVSKERIKGSLVNFICEAKSVSKQDTLIMITCSCKVVQ